MGRAEKYANVIDKEIDKEKEEKLSVTREIRFSDLQKEIDNTVTIADMEEMNVEEEKPRRRVKKEVTEETPEVKPVPKKVVKKKKDDTTEVKIIDEPTAELIAVDGEESDLLEDDLYLTQTIDVVGKKKFKLRKTFKILFTLIFIVVIGLLAYFKVIRPIYLNIVNADPRKVFENSIDYLVDKSTMYIDQFAGSNSSFQFDMTAKIESNMDDYDDLGNVYYGYRYGVDAKKKIYLEETYMKNGSDRYSHIYLEDNGIVYRKYSSYDKYLIIDRIDDKKEDESFYNSIIEKSESKDDLVYFIKKFGEYTKQSFTNEMFSKKEDTIEINSKKVKVTCNTLTINKKNDEEFTKKFEELIKDDERFNNLYAEYFSDDDEFDEDEEIIVNIYTKGFNNKFVGFDVIEDGFRVVYMYFDGNNFDIHINLTEDEDCIKGRDCVASNKEIYDLVGTEKDGGSDVKVSYNGSEVGNLFIRNFNENKIDLDYTIITDGENYKGDLLLMMDKDNKLINYSITYRDKDNKYINFKGDVNYNIRTPLENVKKEDTIELNVKQEEKIDDEFGESFGSDELAEKYLFWYWVINDPSELFTEEESNTA